MNRALAAHHGKYGRACIYEQTRSMVPHAHREGQLVFHLSGQPATFAVSGKMFDIVGRTVLAASPLQVHNVSYDERKEPALLLVLYVDPRWFFKSRRSSHPKVMFGTNAIEMDSSIEDLVQHVTKQLNWDDDLHLFETNLIELTHLCAEQTWQHPFYEQSMQAHGLDIKDRRIQKSLQLMKSRLSSDQVILDVADVAGLSRAQFFKLFRESVGVTPNRYLNILRMETAIDRLINTSDAITSIGLDLGFATQASFTRFFSANAGTPPSDYRRVAQLS